MSYSFKTKKLTLAARRISDPDQHYHQRSHEQEIYEGRLRDAKSYDYFILLPDDQFTAVWEIVNMLLILFVCVTTPARIAFTEDDDLTWIIINSCVESLFLIDLVLNFFSAYHD